MSCAVFFLAAMLYQAPDCAAAVEKPQPEMAQPYLDLAVTYCTYAKSIWHEAEPGGYWGGGIAEKNGNGAVRGMCNTGVGYALLAHAWKNGWLEGSLQDTLTSSGLPRAELLRYLEANLNHITAHHTSATAALEPKWGQSWQSSLWLGAAGVATLLSWDELSSQTIRDMQFTAQCEADRLAAIPPADYRRGDTKAEENGWNMHALAVAIALQPEHPSAQQWWRALRNYAVNTYSVKTDHASSATVGTDPVRDIVKTANLFDDFTLDNHGFFHPDYVQVSGFHLGEAWMMLALGDQRHGGDYAKRFEPYALHHLADVWHGVMKPMLTPSGEFLFPNGNDWTFRCSMNQGYLAWIATGLGDSVAALAEKRGIRAAQDRRKISPPGRILGDSNLEWWWEPLLVKRCTSALLLHSLRPTPSITDEAHATLDKGTWTTFLPDAQVWLHRTPSYAVTAAWGRRRMATFTPFDVDPNNPGYLTLPHDHGILPKSTVSLLEAGPVGDAQVALFALESGSRCALVCLPQSATWISPDQLRPVAIENDRLGAPQREVSWSVGRSVPALTPMEPFRIWDSSLRVDNSLGLITDGNGFLYSPAGQFNRKSAAMDFLVPTSATVWQMLPRIGDTQFSLASKQFHANFTVADDRTAASEIQLRDGNGKRYSVKIKLGSKNRLGPVGQVLSSRVPPLPDQISVAAVE